MIVLLVITFVANGLAIFLRNRYASELVMADDRPDPDHRRDSHEPPKLQPTLTRLEPR